MAPVVNCEAAPLCNMWIPTCGHVELACSIMIAQEKGGDGNINATACYNGPSISHPKHHPGSPGPGTVDKATTKRVVARSPSRTGIKGESLSDTALQAAMCSCKWTSSPRSTFSAFPVDANGLVSSAKGNSQRTGKKGWIMNPHESRRHALSDLTFNVQSW